MPGVSEGEGPQGRDQNTSGWLSLGELSRQTGLRRAWFDEQVKRLNIEVRVLMTPGIAPGRSKHVSPGDASLLLREAKNLLAVPRLGTYVSLFEAAKKLKMSDGWIRRTISEQRLPTIKTRRNHRNLLVEALSPRTMTALQRLVPQIAPAGHHTIVELADITGYANATVAGKLLRRGITPVRYYSPVSGREQDYYGPEAIEAIGYSRDDIPPAGDWVSTTAAARILNRSTKWVQARLTNWGVLHLQEIRLDDTSKPSLHNPPEVLARLRDASINERVPAATDEWYTSARIAQLTRKRPEWVKNELAQPEHAAKGEMRVIRRGNGRAALHYPHSVVVALQAKAKESRRGA